MRPGGRYLHGMDCRSFHISCLLTLCAYTNLHIGIRNTHFWRKNLNSNERKEARRQRRIEQRNSKLKPLKDECDDFDKVFSYEHLYWAYRKCRCGVSWKCSTQAYISNAPVKVYQTYERLHNGKYRTHPFNEFQIMERGKTREIKAVHIDDRVVQRCLCEFALVPMLQRTFIYDNGASTKDKGYTFSANRCKRHLKKHFNKYGSDGYVLVFDFSKFFDRISHKLVKEIIREEFSDERIIKMVDSIIDSFGVEGLGLGSQVSQILALASANRLDHYIKEVLQIECYGRYMDDGYLIHPSKEYLRECLEKIKAMCKELGITMNTKKTRIIKLSHGFTFIKVKFFLLPNGKIIKKLNRASITRERRKLKSLRRKVDDGLLSIQDIKPSWQSWSAYASNFNAYRTVKNMERLFWELYPEARDVSDRKIISYDHYCEVVDFYL